MGKHYFGKYKFLLAIFLMKTFVAPQKLSTRCVGYSVPGSDSHRSCAVICGFVIGGVEGYECDEHVSYGCSGMCVLFVNCCKY